MEKAKRLEAIKSQQSKKESLDGLDGRISEKLDKFISDFNVLLCGGLELKPGGSLDDVCASIERFGVEADSFVGRVARTLADFPELDIPETIKLEYDRSIGDAIKELKLELPIELTEKIDVLDSRIEALAKALTVRQAPSKLVEDYQPVRIVIGDEANLHYLTQMPGSFSVGSSGSGTVGGATTIKQDEIIQTLDDLRGFQIPEYDEIELAYVTSGNGIGEIETVIYKVASSTVATLTLSYDSSDRLSGVVFS